ncbi:MAG: tRNA (adenosine(37)-N6)-threonylcarbamoyltransferase complex dimerization subunit type 1 TsaB [Chitinophagaceae bacterium]|nr:tRNA (adenosine(37)-N6)-threonylcarbamoyltransferase complex dimerization subunit type 1 TsaB [Chitinophagaceae bacterium]
MSLLLHIDTAFTEASVSLAKGGQLIDAVTNAVQNDHAAFLQPAIAGLLKKNNCKLNELSAIAVVAGPGSYTGLRIGMASAKGLCYALNIPLIAINTLELMAYAFRNNDADLLCPMIDARRMEVFTALYKPNGQEIQKPEAVILDEDRYKTLLESSRILFFGNGSVKFMKLVSHHNAFFAKFTGNCSDLSVMSWQFFIKKAWCDLAYTEPLYIKPFYTPAAVEKPT